MFDQCRIQCFVNRHHLSLLTMSATGCVTGSQTSGSTSLVAHRLLSAPSPAVITPFTARISHVLAPAGQPFQIFRRPPSRHLHSTVVASTNTNFIRLSLPSSLHC